MSVETEPTRFERRNNHAQCARDRKPHLRCGVRILHFEPSLDASDVRPDVISSIQICEYRSRSTLLVFFFPYPPPPLLAAPTPQKSRAAPARPTAAPVETEYGFSSNRSDSVSGSVATHTRVRKCAGFSTKDVRPFLVVPSSSPPSLSRRSHAAAITRSARATDSRT